jgi:3-dehydroquinate dehydratase-2
LKKILVINGVNLNFLGIREPQIYGSETLEQMNDYIRNSFSADEVELTFFQSNMEGEIVNAIQNAYQKQDGIVINAGAYTHTSLAIADALRGGGIPAVEVHLSNVFKREEYRHHSYLSPACVAQLCGMGKFGYVCAIRFLLEDDWK